MNTSAEKKIALLIDGDNAQSKFIESMLSEAGKYGKVTIRRIYGDWTGTGLAGWKNQINKYAIRAIQKFAFAKGKNSTDTAMIIEAMDILYSNNVTGFCIASSDSDYTGLAQRIREEGIFVMGIGEAKKTTEAFVNACDIFIYTENLGLENEPEAGREIIKKHPEKSKVKPPKAEVAIVKTDAPKTQTLILSGKGVLPQNKITKKPIDLKFLMHGFEMVVNDSGLAYMGEIGNALRKLDPGFDSRTYGFSSLTTLFKSLSDFFELEYQANGTSLFIRLKKQK